MVPGRGKVAFDAGRISSYNYQATLDRVEFMNC